jgi:hypothetical protein
MDNKHHLKKLLSKTKNDSTILYLCMLFNQMFLNPAVIFYNGDKSGDLVEI